jgi:phytoene synthase
MMELARARARAFGALAVLADAASGETAAVELGLEWSLANVAAKLADERERDIAGALVRSCAWKRRALPRAMRPLAVLHGLSAHAFRRGVEAETLSPGGFARAMRIGLLGR